MFFIAFAFLRSALMSPRILVADAVDAAINILTIISIEIFAYGIKFYKKKNHHPFKG